MNKLTESPTAARRNSACWNDGPKKPEVGCQMSEYEKLEAAAAHLRKSERGRAALRNISQFFQDGGTGLDESNKNACVKLILAAFNNPWDLPANLTNRGDK